jgi:hypothetical protein
MGAPGSDPPRSKPPRPAAAHRLRACTPGPPRAAPSMWQIGTRYVPADPATWLVFGCTAHQEQCATRTRSMPRTEPGPKPPRAGNRRRRPGSSSSSRCGGRGHPPAERGQAGSARPATQPGQSRIVSCQQRRRSSDRGPVRLRPVPGSHRPGASVPARGVRAPRSTAHHQPAPAGSPLERGCLRPGAPGPPRPGPPWRRSLLRGGRPPRPGAVSGLARPPPAQRCRCRGCSCPQR